MMIGNWDAVVHHEAQLFPEIQEAEGLDIQQNFPQGTRSHWSKNFPVDQKCAVALTFVGSLTWIPMQ
jgi:hypothetical protein